MADKCRVEFSNRQKDVAANKQLRDLIRACCAQTLRREGVEFPCLVSVSFVTKDEIRRLNSQSRGVDAVTDVLSFPLEEFEKGVPEGYRPVISPLPLGDIVLCPARAVELSLIHILLTVQASGNDVFSVELHRGFSLSYLQKRGRCHSTVTDFARLRGLSTSHPRSTAM